VSKDASLLGMRILRGLRRRLIAKPEPDVPLLEMLWPERNLDQPPSVGTAAGYRIRQYESGDEEKYAALMASAGMNVPRFEYWDNHILPDGFFVIEHEATGSLAAACFASHHPTPRHPRAGNLGWLAADPAHRGKQLGRSVTAAVTGRLLRGGYRRIYLETHDFRLPAIKLYLKLGWIPLLYEEEMIDRWKLICDRVDWPFTPGAWPR
jgi:mycothiol synthase